MSKSRLKESASAVKKLFGTTAQLAQKQAALATLNNVTLPKIYHAIGKKIVGLDKLPSDLGSHRERIRALEARIAARPDEPTAAPTEGFAAKAKHLAQQAAQKASKASADAAATMQIHAAYVSLGKAAVEKYGDKAVPKECQSDLAAAQSRAALLQSELLSLKDNEGYRITLPNRLCWVAIALYGSSWLLPASYMGSMSISGWEAFRAGLSGGVILRVAALTNVIACVGIAVMFGWRKSSRAARRAMRVLLAASVIWNLLFLLGSVGVGYVVWMAAFVCLFFAMAGQSTEQIDAIRGKTDATASNDIFAVARAIAVCVMMLLCANAVHGFLSSGSTVSESSTVAAAPVPPTPPAKAADDNGADQSMAIAFLWMNALREMRQVEQQRAQRQVELNQRPQRLCLDCDGSGYATQYGRKGPVCGKCGGRGTLDVGAHVRIH